MQCHRIPVRGAARPLCATDLAITPGADCQSQSSQAADLQQPSAENSRGVKYPKIGHPLAQPSKQEGLQVLQEHRGTLNLAGDSPGDEASVIQLSKRSPGDVMQGSKSSPSEATVDEPERQQGFTGAAIAFWCFYAVYLWWLTASPYLPGPAIWNLGAADLKDVYNESINFWYINIGLETLGLPYVPAEASHPVSEALFNFVNTWSFILLPLMVYDARGRKRIPLWIGAMFATNVFMVPYFALRISPGAPKGSPAPKSPLPAVKWPQFPSLFAWPAIIITAISAVWLVAARPEMGGDLGQRWDYFVQAARSDRAFAAFLSDMVLYSIWQYVLMRDAPGLYRRLPYFGILAWYLDFRRPALDGQLKQELEA